MVAHWFESSFSNNDFFALKVLKAINKETTFFVYFLYHARALVENNPAY
jgi:hypothetical protein